MEKHRTGQSSSQRAMRFEQAMRKKEIFVKLQIQEKCFLLSSLWVCQVLLLEYLQNYAVLVKHFFHRLPPFRVKYSFTTISFELYSSALLLFRFFHYFFPMALMPH